MRVRSAATRASANPVAARIAELPTGRGPQDGRTQALGRRQRELASRAVRNFGDCYGPPCAPRPLSLMRTGGCCVGELE
jgi:hypothetical protein